MQSHQIADVLQRPHRDQRDLIRIPADDLGEKFDRRCCNRLVRIEVLRPRELIINSIRRNRSCLPADGNRDIGSAQPVQELARQPRPLRRVGIGDGHAHEVEGWALQRIPERPPVIDISADIGVENNLHSRLLREHRLRCEHDGQNREGYASEAAELVDQFRD